MMHSIQDLIDLYMSLVTEGDDRISAFHSNVVAKVKAGNPVATQYAIDTIADAIYEATDESNDYGSRFDG